MKLMIQIPCFNEADHLAETLAALPRAVNGFNSVEYLIVDDGSDDETVDVARRHGVHHIVRHLENRGLAAAFMTGITSCLALGADVIVTTDGDNQYFGGDISAVVAPVREARADFAMGVRPIGDRRYFPLWKSVLTRIGTLLARMLSGLRLQDAPSGLRAYSAAAASRLRVAGRFSYTMETLILAGSRKWRLASVPIRVNPSVRPSRLISSIPQYIRESTFALLRGVALHRPVLMVVLIALGALLVAMVATVVSGAGNGRLTLSPLPLVFGSILFAMSAVWMWVVRRRASHRATPARDTSAAFDAIVGSDQNSDAFVEEIVPE